MPVKEQTAASPVPPAGVAPTRGAAGTERGMTDAERVGLWQQRLFEAEAGMTKYLVEQHAGAALREWIGVQSAIFADLPEAGVADPGAWQRVFFRAQALMERFVVAHYGHGELAGWARANAAVHGAVERDHGGGSADVIGRVRRQAELYGSRYRVVESSPERSELLISHCSIWDYRERARSRGVPITLASPCEYCTTATSANIAARGYRPEFELLAEDGDRGCRWRASSPARESS